MLFSRLGRSLRFKLVVVSVLVEVVMLTLLLSNSIRIINEVIDRESQTRAESITKLLDSALAVYVFERDFATLNEMLQKLVGNAEGEFSYIRVFDDRDQLYAEVDKKNHSEPGKIYVDNEVLHIASPLMLTGQEIGSFQYGISMQALYASKTSLLRQGLVIAGLEIVLTIILLGTIGFLLTRHMSVLLRGVEDISAGLYNVKIPVKTTDEVGQLANGFNLMAEAIEDRIIEITKSESALRNRTAELESVYNSIADGVVFMNLERVCLRINPAIIDMFGYEPEQMLNHKLDFLYADRYDFVGRGEAHFAEESPDRSDSYELDLIRKDGSKFVGEVNTSRVNDADGNRLGFIAVVRDISRRKEYEHELLEAKEKALVTLESIGDAVITTDEKGFVQYLNPVAETLTEWATQDARGEPLPEVFNICNEKTNEPVENPVDRCLRDNTIVGLANHTVLISRQGKRYAIEDSAAPIRDRQGNILGVILVFHDVSKTRKLAEQLSWQASHDSLTGLINRLEFEVKLARILEADDPSHHAMLYIDLDQFKVVNDTSGHIAGDELLKQLSALFQKHKRESDVLARLGGDEFGMILENCPVDRAIIIGEGILSDLGQFRFLWMGKVFTTGASIGLVPFSNASNDTISSLMSAADVACYAAKDAGRNRIHVYQSDDDSLVQRQGEMQWVSQIEYALEHEKFELYCQPIVSTSSRTARPVHYEILVRMYGSDGELVLPMSFLPAAERYNLMPEIDRWVFLKVMEQLRLSKLDKEIVIAINLSGKSLSDDKFLDFVVHTFEDNPTLVRQICFEITETAAITNLNRVTRFIAALQRLGCQFSLDDFGSGLSSFNYLKNLEVDFLKIDGAFIRDITRDPVDKSMVESINQIGHVMSIKTIAEYVENQETLEVLRDIGVDYAQGYYFSMPFPFANLTSQ